MNWPWRNTYTVRCPDGSTKTVYKCVDDAFPLFIPGWTANLAASGNASGSVDGQMKAEYSTAIITRQTV